MSSNYELKIVSRLSEVAGKTFKPWSIDDIDTIGVLAEEPFEIVFYNNTSQNIHIRLSLNDIDVVTGKEAHIYPNNEGVWFVDPNGSMTLKAWPDVHDFVFDKSGSSITAAVFIESYTPPELPFDRFKHNYGSTQGLITPKLDCIIRVRYVWWDELQVTLTQQNSSTDVQRFI